jgi:hypothetical protein
MKCKVANGYAKVEGNQQIRYRKIIPLTLEFYPGTIGSWMNFIDAELELKLVQKKK